MCDGLKAEDRAQDFVTHAFEEQSEALRFVDRRDHLVRCYNVGAKVKLQGGGYSTWTSVR